jgi:hypothetical protein
LSFAEAIKPYTAFPRRQPELKPGESGHGWHCRRATATTGRSLGWDCSGRHRDPPTTVPLGQDHHPRDFLRPSDRFLLGIGNALPLAGYGAQTRATGLG